MIAYTIFAGADGRPPAQSAHGRRFTEPWDEITHRVRAPKEHPAKEDCPLIKLGTFRGDYRNDANLEAISGIEGDYDDGQVTLADAAMLLYENNISALLYTSPSHAPERPRWRVLCPLSRPHSPPDRARLVARLNGALGGVLSRESFVAAQAFYVGRVVGRPYEVQEVCGQPLDEIEGLAEIGPRINGANAETLNGATDEGASSSVN